MTHRGTGPRYSIQALFAEVLNAKCLLAPDRVMLSDSANQRATLLLFD